MSKILSLKLKDDIFSEADLITHKIHMPRNAYINMAVDFYNKIYQRNLLKSTLSAESQLVSVDSLTVLHEFEKFQEDFK